MLGDVPKGTVNKTSSHPYLRYAGDGHKSRPGSRASGPGASFCGEAQKRTPVMGGPRPLLDPAADDQLARALKPAGTLEAAQLLLDLLPGHVPLRVVQAGEHLV